MIAESRSPDTGNDLASQSVGADGCDDAEHSCAAIQEFCVFVHDSKLESWNRVALFRGHFDQTSYEKAGAHASEISVHHRMPKKKLPVKA